LQNTTCDDPTHSLFKAYEETRTAQLQEWENNESAYKLDTTLPPLDSIFPGLQELLEKHFLYASVNGTPPLGIISNATSNPNPTGDETIISFGVSQEAYIKIQLFDVLGQEVSSVSGESLFEPGNTSVPISLAGLPGGTYYARMMTNYGEVQTVKIKKQ
jgi:hypothetical protein